MPLHSTAASTRTHYCSAESETYMREKTKQCHKGNIPHTTPCAVVDGWVDDARVAKSGRKKFVPVRTCMRVVMTRLRYEPVLHSQVQHVRAGRGFKLFFCFVEHLLMFTVATTPQTLA